MEAVNLYQIESDLQQLVDMREAAEAEGDSEALVVIDNQLTEYILSKEPEKVRSTVNFIRWRESQAASCKAEKERWADLQHKAEADVKRVKANVLGCMQAFDIKALNDERTGQGFRRQGNGGVQPLDIPEWPRDSSGDFELLRMDTEGSGRVAPSIPQIPLKLFVAPDTERIREALARGEQVPGAKLLPRGEHLRVL